MMKITRLFRDFTSSERSSGFILIITAVISLVITNTGLGDALIHFYHTEAGFTAPSVDLRMSVEHWINDGLMTLFFLLVGLEIERELYGGELSTLANASLPLLAALGGMLAPFLLHYSLNAGTPAQRGGGIPMATDIAFALGILSLAKRVPFGLKVFLTAFAIIDDLGAILIIAFFYTDNLSMPYLFAAGGTLGLLFILNRLKVHRHLPYIIFGLVLWFCLLQSGVHATLAGVLLAFALPYGSGDEDTLSWKWQHALHKPVAFIILPVFAFVNTGIPIEAGWVADLGSPNSLGIILGLVVGKPLGIAIICGLALYFGWSRLPRGVGKRHLLGASILGGIGFTMSIFITLLAFDDAALIAQSKMAILASSVLASALGLLVLNMAGPRSTADGPQ